MFTSCFQIAAVTRPLSFFGVRLTLPMVNRPSHGGSKVQTGAATQDTDQA